ncbi:MAG: hypothetical protein WDA71_04770 [Actinomycetota bacterium]
MGTRGWTAGDDEHGGQLREQQRPKVVSEALGHRSVGFTMDTYAHVLPSTQAEDARVLQEILGEHESR